MPHKDISADAGAESISVLDKVRTADGPKSTNEIRSAMQRSCSQTLAFSEHKSL
jgi:succinate dehydrogenase (ubiquinone) flavoprotein subunit